MGGNVLTFGFVSFLTDVSSEMIYPLLPLFVTTVLGAGAAMLGMIEGVAESTAAFLKLLSGFWADRLRNRTRLVLAGYGLSALARPCMAIAQYPWHVLGVRFADRIGKGVRTSPRDAMIADAVAPTLRGKAFGFQRSMDHAGAVMGPVLATVLLATCVRNLRTLFWLAAIPGILAVLLIAWRVRDATPRHPLPVEDGRSLRALPHGVLRRYLLILLLFTLGNSSDAFLLLRASQLGIATATLPLVWAMFHVVKTLTVMPFGALSDRIDRRHVIMAGWMLYAVTYLGFGVATTPGQAWALFAIYGVFYGLTEGVERALLTDLAAPRERGAAFGWYHFTVGIGALPASLIFGLIWQQASPQAAFLFGASLAGLASILLGMLVRTHGRHAIAS